MNEGQLACKHCLMILGRCVLSIKKRVTIFTSTSHRVLQIILTNTLDKHSTDQVGVKVVTLTLRAGAKVLCSHTFILFTVDIFLELSIAFETQFKAKS